MRMEVVDLYEYGQLRRNGAAGGKLTCWVLSSPEAISPCRRRPAVLILPGGAYARTSSREAEPVALRFAARGYAAFVLDYSCAPSFFPVSLREAALAMRYIRENCDALEVNPGMVAAIGFSAGGHLCGTLGTMYDSDVVSDIDSGNLIRPDGLGLCYPVAVSWGDTHQESFRNISGGDDDLRERLSLDRLVRPDMPPVFLWHTRNDGAVPVRNSLILGTALANAGVDFAMHIYRNGPHGLSTADEQAYPICAVPETSWDVPGWVESMIRFFEELGFRIEDREVSG